MTFKAPDLDIPGVPITKRKIVRVFLAHAKADSAGSIEAMRSTLIRLLTQASAGTATIEVILGRDDYDANFKRAGGWDQWARDISDRIDFATRERFYSAIVVTSVYVGKATAQMVEHALAVGVRTMLLNGFEVKAIIGIDKTSDSFQTGWRVRT